MNKKKLLALFAVLALGTASLIGGTLAYFTDDESATNTFTMGNVEIDLIETPDEDPADGEWDGQLSDLAPGVDIDKNVFVKNTSDYNKAYVRVHIAIPEEIDDGDPTFAANKNFLHWNFTKESVADGQWSWIPEYTEGTGYLGNGKGNWNFYTTKIDGKDYNVYVATYRTALEPGQETTTEAITKVYLDKTVDGEYVYDETTGERTGIKYTDDNGNVVEYTLDEARNIQIHVVAEAAQVETFENAYDALNAAFGVPGTYEVAWPTTTQSGEATE